MEVYKAKIDWKANREGFISSWMEDYSFKVSPRRTYLIFNTCGDASAFYYQQAKVDATYYKKKKISFELKENKIRVIVEKVTVNL